MKLNDVISSVEALRILSKLPLKAAVSFRIAKLLREVDVILQDFGSAQAALQDKYKNTEGEGFRKEFAGLLDEDVTLNVPTITLADLGDIEIEPVHLMTLSWLIREE